MKKEASLELLYFSNSNNSVGNTATVVIGYLTDLLKVGDKIVGDKSNASYEIVSLDTNPLKSVLVVTTPNPITAQPDDEFGFSETITEFPNIT